MKQIKPCLKFLLEELKVIILKEFLFPFYISVLVITGLSPRVSGVALIFGVVYSLLYEGKDRKKLYRIAPDDIVLAFKIFIDVQIGVGPLNFFFLSYN